MYLLRIVTPHFVAGLEIADSKVHRAAPIVGYMKGWSLVKVMICVRDKNWSSSLVLDEAANRHLLGTRTESRPAAKPSIVPSPAGPTNESTGAPASPPPPP